MKYRPEIDGLRAIAVIPVLFFHAGLESFNGGFVGVDVFFVISGYLITTIILSEMEEGRFSLVNFYERRARRILPALFLVLLISIPFAWLWLLPSDLKDFSQSLVSVSAFASNILFWQETGYWEAASEYKPLLHTWSLAVEEQYYVLFPLFLMMMWGFRKRWILGSFMFVAAISLMTSQWMAFSDPTANFFLLPSRVWELAMGASIAFYFLYRKSKIHILLSHKHISEVLGVTGLVMIGYAVYMFDESVPFPGLYALVPTIGTGLIILASSPQTVVGRLLGNKIMVGIGLISYSAYLWHFPLYVFARHRSLIEPGEMVFLSLAFLSFPLAFISWKYLERPFRNKKKLSRKTVFVFALTGSLIFAALGVAGHLSNGFENRRTASNFSLRSIEQKLEQNYGLSRTCEGTFKLSPDCRTSDAPEIVLWGDSYAMHLAQGIISSNPNTKIIQMTKSVCGPLFDVAAVPSSNYPIYRAESCLEFSEQVRKWLKGNKSIKYAVLSSPFVYYLKENSALLFRNGELLESNLDLLKEEFVKTLEELESMGITPVVFSPPPGNGTDIGRCLARADLLGLNLDKCSFPAEDISQDIVSVYGFLDYIRAYARVVRLDEHICQNSRCDVHFGSTYIYRDKGHLSHDGSGVLGNMAGFYSLIVEDFP